MRSDSQVVIGADGTILAVAGQWPEGLVDSRVEDCGDLPREIRAAGHALLHQRRRSGHRMLADTVVCGDGRTVELIAVEALAVRRVPTDLRALLASKLDVMASQAAAAGIALVVVIADAVPAAVHLDAEKAAWAVTTLVGNALRYVRTGSPRVSGGAIRVHVGFELIDSTLTIDVQDDGPGIPADTVTRLFKRDGLNVRGAGLSLLMISDVCVAHGGAVEVRSATGASDHGTTIRMTFPARDDGTSAI